MVSAVLPSSTPVVAFTQAPLESVFQPTSAPVLAVLDPLSFTFPTTGPEPISLWRPPLYPVPWEPTPYDHFYFTRPIGANEVNWPLAKYRYGGLLYAEPHTGIDIPVPKGTPVLAAGPGEVIWAGWGLFFLQEQYKDPYGIAVAIKHDFGYSGQAIYTIYGHLNETYVYRGQRVESGEVIGLVGETGKTSGPHLHFEVRVGDSTFYLTRNPELWLAPPQGWGVLVGQVLNSDGYPMYKANVELLNEATKKRYSVVTYSKGAVNSDAYYQENVVLGDLPAGPYTMWIKNEGVDFKASLEIKPGMVTYFKFKGKFGYDFSPPPAPGPTFVPPDATAAPTP
jgi:murein DD-endopeptidase MepM/ murein hydrolase activator NlpD